MRIGQVVILFLVVNICASNYDVSDSVFISDGEIPIAVLPWQGLYVDSSSKSIRFSERAAIIGKRGIEVSLKRREHTGFSCRSAHLSESWQRFYLRVDHCSFDKRQTYPNDLRIGMGLCNYGFSEKVKNDQPYTYISFFIRYHVQKDSLILLCSCYESVDSLRSFSFSIAAGKLYCVESYVSFFSKDSVMFELFINGHRFGSMRSIYYYGRDWTEIGLNDDYSASSANDPIKDSDIIDKCTLVVSLDAFKISRDRPFAIPSMPERCGYEKGHDGFYKIFCAPFSSEYVGEAQKGIRWRVVNEVDTIFPIFDEIEANHHYFNIKSIPFGLDSGRYFWSARFLNTFDRWSEWSKKCTIHVNEPRDATVMLKDVYISKKPGGSVIKKVCAGDWYYLNAAISGQVSLDSLGYFIAWLHDTSYTMGNISNKGGKFHPSSSYVLNLSLRNGQFSLFEKTKENSSVSNPVSTGAVSLYLDGRADGYIVDTTRKRISIKFKLLPIANTGLWHLFSTLVYSEHRAGSYDSPKEINSNLVGFSFTVVHPFGVIRFLRVTILLTVLSGAILILFMSVKRKNSALNNISDVDDEEFQNIVRYIEVHMESELTVDSVLKALKISKARFYNIMRSKNVEFRKLLAEIRLKRAKQLLEESNMNISEVAFKVGFSNLSHFTYAFKKLFNQLPSQVVRGR